jgi:DNA-binding MarR family transcriptional regulator
MNEEEKVRLIQQVMGAAHVFCTAMSEMLEYTLEEATDEPLAMSQVKLLLLIARPGQRYKVSDVAEFLDVTNAAASRAIDRLVQRGLVDRTVSTGDRRAVDLALTPQGETLLRRFTERRNEELLARLGQYPEEKLQRATELLDEVTVLLLDLGSRGLGDRCLRCGIHFRDGCVVRDVLGRECVLARVLFDPEPRAGEPRLGGAREVG